MMQTDSEGEILDLVDENDQVIGNASRKYVYDMDLNNYRVIDAFIKNSKGQLFIPRRTAHKRLFPSCLDSSVGGHVESGTTYEETLFREAFEELNIDVSRLGFRCLGKLSPFNDGVRSFITVYEILSDDIPNYNPKDFCTHYWLTPQELISKVAAGEDVKTNLPLIIKHFYL